MRNDDKYWMLYLLIATVVASGMIYALANLPGIP